IYYNEVIRQQPGSSESEKAKRRIDQLRAKVGDKYLQPVVNAQAVAEKKKESSSGSTAKNRSPAGDAATTSAPLPPAETDTSLPPAASLLPDTTTAPAGSTGSSTGSSLDNVGSSSSSEP